MPGLDPGINSRHCFAVPYWVYILANFKRGTLYVGVTNDLVRRVFQHRERITPGFTSRYAVTRLVHYEQHDDPHTAIQREKNLKHWSRDWKIALTEKGNPDWRVGMTRSRHEQLMPGSSPGMTMSAAIAHDATSPRTPRNLSLASRHRVIPGLDPGIHSWGYRYGHGSKAMPTGRLNCAIT